MYDRRPGSTRRRNAAQNVVAVAQEVERQEDGQEHDDRQPARLGGRPRSMTQDAGPERLRRSATRAPALPAGASRRRGGAGGRAVETMSLAGPASDDDRQADDDDHARRSPRASRRGPRGPCSSRAPRRRRASGRSVEARTMPSTSGMTTIGTWTAAAMATASSASETSNRQLHCPSRSSQIGTSGLAVERAVGSTPEDLDRRAGDGEGEGDHGDRRRRARRSRPGRPRPAAR